MQLALLLARNYRRVRLCLIISKISCNICIYYICIIAKTARIITASLWKTQLRLRRSSLLYQQRAENEIKISCLSWLNDNFRLKMARNRVSFRWGVTAIIWQSLKWSDMFVIWSTTPTTKIFLACLLNLVVVTNRRSDIKMMYHWMISLLSVIAKYR